MWWRWEYGFLLLASTSVDFFCARKMGSIEERKKRLPYLLLSLLSNLGLLGFFKYSGFLAELILDPTSLFEGGDIAFKLVLPIGISFYTFQTLSYTIDVFRGKAQPQNHFGKFALFVSFFPQLVSGPIERYNSLMPQLGEGLKFNANKWRSGLQLVIWGFFKKLCVADRIAALIDPIYANPEAFPAVLYPLCGLLFLVQIYCDFSGYTDIATGVARLFGVDLSVNWKQPLFAFSNRNFWRRWHITLSTWFRDYVYVPLGGSRQPYFLIALSLLIVFALSGLWHGANTTFVLWGVGNGILVMIEFAFARSGLKLKRGRAFGWIFVLVTQSLLFIVFRSESGNDALYMLSHIFSSEFLAVSLPVAVEQHFQLFSMGLTAGCVLLLLGKECWELLAWRDVKWKPARPLFYVVVVWIIFTVGTFNTDEFIYFQF